MATPAEIINAAIENSLQMADNFTAQVDAAADRALALSEGRSWGATPHWPVYKVDAVEPELPAVEDATLIYDAQLNNLIGLLSTELSSYFTKYYPLASDAFDASTNWLINTITNGGTGIPKAVEDQIWQRARDRILRDGQRTTNTIMSGYSARGFSLVQGPMIHDLNQARFESNGKIGEASTTIATKQAEIQIETMKFAINQAIDSRFKAMNAASDYIRSVMSAPDAASRLASLNTDAKAKMIAATSDLYRARLTRDQLVIGSQTDYMNASVQAVGNYLNADQGKINGEVQAAGVAAEAYAKVAASAIAQFNGVMSSTVSAFS